MHDYKNSPRRARRGGGRVLIAGITIGVLLGIVAALAIALMLNRNPSPYVNRVQQPEPKPSAAEVRAPQIVKPIESKPPETNRFDFYEMLPANTPEPEPVRPADTRPAPAAKPPARKDNLYLQAGSFRSAADADNLKARLALMGMEASVAEAQVPGMGAMYRVRIGPYRSPEQLDSIKSQLARNGIAATIVHSSVQ